MSATNTATVAILNLYSTEKYFSKFEVECWNSAETTLISSLLVEGRWDSSVLKWVQIDAAYFYGLTMGTVYHFRARVISQGGGLPSAWSAFTAETAGDNTPPSVTYTGSNRANDASVAFNIVPTTSDTDIHHYEVYCKAVLIGSSAPSAPASTDLPTEPSQFTTQVYGSTLSISFEKSLSDAHKVYVWLRAVDTSGNVQAWTSFGSGFLTNGAGNAQGQNLLNNGSFEIPAESTSSTDNTVQGWGQGANNLCTVTQDTTSGTYTTGLASLLMSQQPSLSVPALTTLVCVYQNSNVIRAIPGQWYVLRFKARYDRGGSAPVAGLTNHIRGSVDFFDNTGTSLGGTDTNHLLDADNGTGWQTLSATMQAPVNATTVVVTLWNYVANSTGGALTLSSSLPLDARFDAVELIKAADTTTDEVTKRGSTPPSYAGSISYTSNTSSITWSWSVTIYRTDLALGSVTVSGSLATTGLSASTTYYFYPYFDEPTQSLQFVTGGSGSTGWAQTAPSRTLTQAQNRSDRVPLSLSSVPASTTGGGPPGGGGGGGDGSCIRRGTYVKEKNRGIVLAETLRKGEYIWSEKDTWLVMLHDAHCATTDMFIHNEFNCGQILDVTITHPWTLRDRSVKKSPEINLLDEFISTTGIAHAVNIKLLKEEGDKVIVCCEYPHVFWAATVLDAPWILTHNNIQPT